MAPTPDETCQNHYNTFIQQASIENKMFGDSGQPSVLRKGIESCEHCKSYGFTSKTEKQRHIAVFHRRQVRNLKYINFLFKFGICLCYLF